MTAARSSRWTVLLFAVAGVAMALGEATWHRMRSCTAEIADLSAATARIQAIDADLGARLVRIRSATEAALARASSEAARAKIRAQAEYDVIMACHDASQNADR